MNGPLTRREAMVTLSSGISVVMGGCVNADSSTPETSSTAVQGSPTTDDNSTARNAVRLGRSVTNSSGASLAISDPIVRKIIISPDAGVSTHAYPIGGRLSQFLVVSVEASGMDSIQSPRIHPVVDNQALTHSGSRLEFSPGLSGHLGFAIPVRTWEQSALRWQVSDSEEYVWEMPQTVTENLRTAPRFDAVGFDVPQSFERGEEFRAQISVANTGERAGRFVGTVVDQGPSSVPLVSAIAFPVSVGERVTREITGRDVTTETTAVFDWGIGKRQADVCLS